MTRLAKGNSEGKTSGKSHTMKHIVRLIGRTGKKKRSESDGNALRPSTRTNRRQSATVECKSGAGVSSASNSVTILNSWTAADQYLSEIRVERDVKCCSKCSKIFIVPRFSGSSEGACYRCRSDAATSAPDMAKGKPASSNPSKSKVINDTLKENCKDSEVDENGVKLGCGDWLVLDSESNENVDADAGAFENFKQEPSEGFVMLS